MLNGDLMTGKQHVRSVLQYAPLRLLSVLTHSKHVLATGTNSIGIRFDNKPWEQLRSIPVDREGEYIYTLRPRTTKGSNKLMCEVVIKDNVKTVTLRSTYKVENQTFYPLEVAMVDNTGHPVSSIDKIGTRQPDQIFHDSDLQESSWRGLRITN